jgi:predicted membrane channel-forming protein YqfA (hemolysin III family)
MKTYARAFLIAGVIIPTLLHMLARESTPWWPDTVSLGIAFGAAAIAIVWKDRKDRETRRRLWNALRAIGDAIGRSWTSR